MAIRSGLVTGLMGYSLKKEFLGDAIYYRQTETFEYEAYSLALDTLSPTDIQTVIKEEFANRSGDISVRVLQSQAAFDVRSDSVRSAKFNVAVEVRNTVDVAQIHNTELSSDYYAGLDGAFFTNYALYLQDFREGFSFEHTEGGNEAFSHDISFALRSGSRSMAVALATGLFSHDQDTTFGIGVMVGKSYVADTGNYLNYFTEVYDELKQTYKFVKRREILPLTGVNYLHTFNHTMDTREDGITDVTEKCEIKGVKYFSQAQQACDNLITSSFDRCSGFYEAYRSDLITSPLINLPLKTTKNFNHYAIDASYDISYTNNPNFSISGMSTEETFDFNVSEASVVDLKHNLDFTVHRRASQVQFDDLFIAATGSSQATCNSYYDTFVNNDFYRSDWPLKLIKQDFTWPSRGSKGGIHFQYSNHPKYFVTFEGIEFRVLDAKVIKTLPVDIVTEYKIINRPSRTSIVNYAYQTEKGQVTVNIDAGLGRNPNEFYNNGFRTGYENILTTVYHYGINTFMGEFNNVIPLSFTYYLDDVKFSLNNDGVLAMSLSISYTLKKYKL